MKKFFVDTTGNGEGYVVEADTCLPHGNFVMFSSGTELGADILTVSGHSFVSIEEVTAEDVDYIDENGNVIAPESAQEPDTQS